jgi:hypothetical protein
MIPIPNGPGRARRFGQPAGLGVGAGSDASGALGATSLVGYIGAAGCGRANFPVRSGSWEYGALEPVPGGFGPPSNLVRLDPTGYSGLRG